eukprot:541379_1
MSQKLCRKQCVSHRTDLINNRSFILRDNDCASESINSFPSSHHLRQRLPFKSFDNRLIACNGDCGSSFSILVNQIVCRPDQVLEKRVDVNETIENAFWCHGCPLRNVLIKLMQQHQLANRNEFYTDVYSKITSSKCFIQGNDMVDLMLMLLRMLCMDHVAILEYMANYSCQIPERSLLEEISSYYQQKMIQLQAELQVITSMIASSNYMDIVHSLRQQKSNIEDQINNCKKNTINKRKWKHKIERIKQSEQFQIMKKKKVILSELEILSIIIYCDHNSFAYKMRESQREKSSNSCEWRNLFYHLNSCVKKMHKVFHLKNYAFYKQYVTHEHRKNNKLFHGMHNRALHVDHVTDISLHTITSFSECFGVANCFTYQRGMVFAINDAYKAIYNGDLVAANVSWISHFCEELEWIVLPTKFKHAFKIKGDSALYYDCIRDLENVEIYELNLDDSQYICDVGTCKSLSRIRMMLCWYRKKSRIANESNIIEQYMENIEKRNNRSWNDFQHIIFSKHCAVGHTNDGIYAKIIKYIKKRMCKLSTGDKLEFSSMDHEEINYQFTFCNNGSYGTITEDWKALPDYIYSGRGNKLNELFQRITPP